MAKKRREFMADLSEIYALLARDDGKSLVQTIEDKINGLDASQRQISEALGIQRKTLQRILEGEAQKIDLLTILKLSQFLNISIEDISKVYVSGLPTSQVGELERARKAGFIMRHFDLDVLKKIGFIQDVSDFDNIENRIKKYFNIGTIEEYADEVAYSLFSKTRNKSCDKMTKFWISSAYGVCTEIKNPNPFDRQLLLEIIPRLRLFTRDESNGFVQAVRALYQAGVTVVVQGYVSKIQIRGATFSVNGKPCIAVSDFNKRYDTLWFTLMHELYHVIKDFDTILKFGFHTSIAEEGQQRLDFIVNEETANTFANEVLIASDKRKFIRSFLDIPEIVESYAKKWGVHSSIVYGLHIRNNEADIPKYRGKILKSDQLLKAYFAYSWEQESPSKVAQHYKENIHTINK